MRISLAKISTRSLDDVEKQPTKAKTEKILENLNELQNLLYAQGKYSVLVVIQGMDASGKDGTIRKVFTSMNPQGVEVKSFKVPTPEELSHDFLWRVHQQAPAKGMIQIFNRSHYEDIIVTRVHQWCDNETAQKRMKAINDFEWLLSEHNNTIILKFYLHVSQEEQLARLNERIRIPAKMWKYNENDFTESKLWNEYMRMYEDCFEHCNDIPWIIVPSDQNWYKEYIVASTLRDKLESLNMQYPGTKK